MDRRQFALRSVVLGTTAVLAATSFVACADGKPPKVDQPSAIPVSIAPAPTTTKPLPPTSAKGGPTSNLSELTKYGVDIGTPVLIDVAADGRDRFLEAQKNAAVDFGGTNQVDATMMVLRPAAVKATNRVVINAPRWNPELGADYCVAESAVLALWVEPCRAGDPDQIWHVVPLEDSGQFRLDGRYGTVHVDYERVTPDDIGRTGLQTVPFSG